jgi:hypothetical protein
VPLRFARSRTAGGREGHRLMLDPTQRPRRQWVFESGRACGPFPATAAVMAASCAALVWGQCGRTPASSPVAFISSGWSQAWRGSLLASSTSHRIYAGRRTGPFCCRAESAPHSRLTPMT